MFVPHVIVCCFFPGNTFFFHICLIFLPLKPSNGSLRIFTAQILWAVGGLRNQFSTVFNNWGRCWEKVKESSWKHGFRPGLYVPMWHTHTCTHRAETQALDETGWYWPAFGDQRLQYNQCLPVPLTRSVNWPTVEPDSCQSSTFTGRSQPEQQKK